MKIEPRYCIFQATFLAFKGTPWKSCTPPSHLSNAIILCSAKRKKPSTMARNASSRCWIRWRWMDGKEQWVGKPNSRRHSTVSAGKGLPLQHRHTPRVWPGNHAPHSHQCNSSRFWGMQISCASAENTGLVCLTSCRWKTVGSVSRSGFESWPVATINKKLKSFTVCTYSF